MKTKLLSIFIVSLLISCTHVHTYTQQAADYVAKENPLTEGDVANGLKEALVKGCDHAVNFAGKTDGFYKNPNLFIPFPEEAIKVKEYALKVGLTDQVNAFEENMNRAAEKSAAVSKDILVQAVQELTIQDAWSILKGKDDAATQYLKSKTQDALYEQFLPISQKAINEVEVTKYWNPLAAAYNKTTFLTGEKSVNPDLDQYITERALSGLYLMIEKEEKLIRKDPLERTTDLLKKVFAQQ